jgi:hypothetical protein
VTAERPDSAVAVELVRLVEKLQQPTLELAGRVGYLQAELAQAREQLALMAPVERHVDVTRSCLAGLGLPLVCRRSRQYPGLVPIRPSRWAGAGSTPRRRENHGLGCTATGAGAGP